ncbi:hypothetical protein SynPROSU1_00688 [Synechococcus sp. PROS-U-1]|nr:hypothetical protein SynPROSU1_00688 [Synechococcus sp. PROS-U-1]
MVTAFNSLDQPTLKCLTLYRDNGGTQPTLDISTQIAKGMCSTVLARHEVDSGQRPRRTEASPSNADSRERHDQLQDAMFAGCEATKA